MQQCSLTFCLKQAKKVSCWKGGWGWGDSAAFFSLQEPTPHQSDFIDVGAFRAAGRCGKRAGEMAGLLCMSEFLLFSLGVCLPPLQGSQRRREDKQGTVLNFSPEYITFQDGRTFTQSFLTSLLLFIKTSCRN